MNNEIDSGLLGEKQQEVRKVCKIDTTIEVRYRRKYLAPMCVAAIVIVLTMNYFLWNDNKSIYYKIASSAFGGWILFVIAPTIKRMIMNEPIVTLMPDKIVLNVGRRRFIHKVDIRYIDVIYEEEKGYFLEIKTENKRYSVNVSWMDRTPDDVRDLVKFYEPIIGDQV